MSEQASLENLQRAGAYGLLLRDSQVLLVRATGSTGRWWLPGGGIDFGESPSQCVVREFQEETGFDVRPTELLDVVSDVIDYPERRLRVHTTRVLYRVKVVGGAIRSEVNGSTDVAHWHRIGDALTLPLVPFTKVVLDSV